jgi:polyisoprenoid-binding protein YceI
MKKYNIFVFVLVSFLYLNSAIAGHYEIDKDHTTITFAIKHLVISKVKGSFDNFSGDFDYDAKNVGASKVNTTIQTDSINTAVKKRDDHLKSADFFDVAKFPTITFTSKKVNASGKKAKIEGDLTIHGVTKPVVLDVEMNGAVKDPWGNNRAGFSAKTKVNRKDFGLTWNKALEAGGFVVGDDVEISIEIEGIEKPTKT